MTEPIAITGIGLRMPSLIDSPKSLWDLITTGKSVVRKIPEEFPRKVGIPYGGVIENIRGFDPELFNIFPVEAHCMDPLQRLSLMACWDALQHSGIDIKGIQGKSVGVFAGSSGQEYNRVESNSSSLHPMDGTGTAGSVIAGRISYCMDFRGPAITVDTACSSSAVAVHLACMSLRANESDLALAGGGSLILDDRNSTIYKKANMLSPHYRCASFREGADGFVRSEGVGFLLLKRLSDALRDSDNIVAVIKASAMNQDGKSNGLTAPNLNAQVDVINRALDAGSIDKSSIAYIEAHGSGTSLGDTVEICALDEVFQGSVDDIKVGSIKSQLGHTEFAAGIAGVMKAALCQHYGSIPSSLLAGEQFKPNPLIEWDEIVPSFNTTAIDIANDNSCIGVSSFGFSGTNCHIILGKSPILHRNMEKPSYGFSLTDFWRDKVNTDQPEPQGSEEIDRIISEFF